MSHGDARFVRPSQRPPDLIGALWLALVIREVSSPGRVEPDRHVKFGHQIEERHSLRSIERAPQYVGEYLDADCAQVLHRSLRLLQQPLGVVHGQRSDKAGETVGVTLDQFRQPVVSQSCHVRGHRGRAIDFLGWSAETYDLHIVREFVHYAEPLVEVDDAGSRTHPPMPFPPLWEYLTPLVKIGLRIDVIE